MSSDRALKRFIWAGAATLVGYMVAQVGFFFRLWNPWIWLALVVVGAVGTATTGAGLLVTSERERRKYLEELEDIRNRQL